MTIAITDACIFIDLIDLEITSEFFDLDLDVHTTIDVWNEMNNSQKQLLKAYSSVNKLTIHILEPKDHLEMETLQFPKALSGPDRSVIYIAHKLNAMLLSSDGLVRKFAERRAISRHGMFWILDELVGQKILTKLDAHRKLRELTERNEMYLGNQSLQSEITKRLNEWS